MSAFKPAWWLPGPHLQTIWPSLYRKDGLPSPRRERVWTPDDDFLDLDWCGNGEGPIVLLLHGLTGSSRSSYVAGLSRVLCDYGFTTAALNFRGCSGEPNHTAWAYHSGETTDLDWIYRHIKDCYPTRPLSMVGYSLGGNVLLKWLGQQGVNVHVQSAITVSVPFLLNICADQMDKGFSRIYRDRLLNELKEYIIWKKAHLDMTGRLSEAERLHRLGDLSSIRSFWEYDGHVVSGIYGFKGADDYYAQSSSRYYLSGISVPTLMIQAKDDPFMSKEVIPSPSELSGSSELLLTEHGGHVGFVNGSRPWRYNYWLEHRVLAFLQNHSE